MAPATSWWSASSSSHCSNRLAERWRASESATWWASTAARACAEALGVGDALLDGVDLGLGRGPGGGDGLARPRPGPGRTPRRAGAASPRPAARARASSATPAASQASRTATSRSRATWRCTAARPVLVGLGQQRGAPVVGPGHQRIPVGCQVGPLGRGGPRAATAPRAWSKVAVDHYYLVALANQALTWVRQRVTREQLGHRGRKTDPAGQPQAAAARPGTPVRQGLHPDVERLRGQ